MEIAILQLLEDHSRSDEQVLGFLTEVANRRPQTSGNWQANLIEGHRWGVAKALLDESQC
jgi:hypothetical protein